jgi:hypothetical protein
VKLYPAARAGAMRADNTIDAKNAKLAIVNTDDRAQEPV